MAFSIKIVGDDILEDAHKAVFERHLVEEVAAFVARYATKPSVSVKSADVETDNGGKVSVVPPPIGNPTPVAVTEDESDG